MKNKISTVLNILLIIFIGIGTWYMFRSAGSGGVLSSEGLGNLKYFTVLSNLFCGIVAAASLISRIRGGSISMIWKYIAATEVALTFVIIACFLQPMYPSMNMYEGGNFWFHLICPLTAIAELVVLSISRNENNIIKGIPFRWPAYAAIPTFLYGLWYLTNILINGTGTWPDTNDFYGFMNWGLPVGIGIFCVNVLMTWGIALILRLPNLAAVHFRKESGYEN